MTRINTPDTIVQKPTNNVYTALTVVATVAVILALVVTYLSGNTLFGEGWLSGVPGK
jgi:hypothetical protein